MSVASAHKKINKISLLFVHRVQFRFGEVTDQTLPPGTARIYPIHTDKVRPKSFTLSCLLGLEKSVCADRQVYQPVHLPSQTFLQQDVSTTNLWHHHFLPKELSPESEPAQPDFYMLLPRFLPNPLLAKNEPIQKERKTHLSEWCGMFPPCRQLKTSGTGVTQLETNTLSSWQHSGTKRCVWAAPLNILLLW